MNMYSDNEIKFIGAERLHAEISGVMKDREVQEKMATKRVQWDLIPPRSQNFGGFWESAVKAMKHHFK